MKKLLIVTCLTCALAVAAHAAEGDTKKEGGSKKKSSLTVEQKAARKELLEKYDTNKNGRLDKDERAKMTAADQEKWSSITPAGKKKASDAEKK